MPKYPMRRFTKEEVERVRKILSEIDEGLNREELMDKIEYNAEAMKYVLLRRNQYKNVGDIFKMLIEYNADNFISKLSKRECDSHIVEYLYRRGIDFMQISNIIGMMHQKMMRWSDIKRIEKSYKKEHERNRERKLEEVFEGIRKAGGFKKEAKVESIVYYAIAKMWGATDTEIAQAQKISKQAMAIMIDWGRLHTVRGTEDNKHLLNRVREWIRAGEIHNIIILLNETKQEQELIKEVEAYHKTKYDKKVRESEEKSTREYVKRIININR